MAQAHWNKAARKSGGDRRHSLMVGGERRTFSDACLNSQHAPEGCRRVWCTCHCHDTPPTKVHADE